MNQWTFGGRTFPFDLTGGDGFRALVRGLDYMKSYPSPESEAEEDGAAAYCAFIGGFFETVLGEGTTAALFGEAPCGTRCTEAYLSFLDYLLGEAEELSRLRQTLEERYLGAKSTFAGEGAVAYG